MKYLTVNESQAFKDWGETIVGATKLTLEHSEEKVKWMSTMMSVNERIEKYGDGNPMLNEDYGSLGSNAMPGMGAAAWPSDPGTGVGAEDGAFFRSTYKQGSGDIPSAKLAIAMNVAAYTIGLELLPVIPMEFPTMMYSYLDHVYAGGTLDNAAALPIYLEVSGGTIGTSGFDYSNFAKGDDIFIHQYDEDGGTNGGAVIVVGALAIRGTFVTKHRISANLIFKLEALGTLAANGDFTADAAKSVSDIVTGAFVGANSAWGASAGSSTAATAPTGTPEVLDGSTIGATIKAELVSAIDTHIEEFSNADAAYQAGGPDRISSTREQGENGTQNSISLRLFSTSVEAGTVEVLANITKTQLKDLAAYGVDGMNQIYKAAQNELTQTINKDILRTLFRLGVTSAAQLKAAQNFDINLFIADTGTASEDLANFGLSEFVDIVGADRTGDFTGVVNAENNSSAENVHTRQRRIGSRILAAANMISIVGRHGKGDFAVVNGQVASALQDVKGFLTTPFENTLSVQTKNMYYIGSLQGGIAVYCDPNMIWSDTRVLVGRKGTQDDPGLKFFAYQLAESIETISETSMSPKVAVTSRYTLTAAGFYPEAQYLCFGLLNSFGNWL